MLDLYKSSIVLKVQKLDKDGEPKTTSVTLAKVRTDLTPNEMNQLIEAFRTLISHEIVYAELLQYSYIA